MRLQVVRVSRLSRLQIAGLLPCMGVTEGLSIAVGVGILCLPVTCMTWTFRMRVFESRLHLELVVWSCCRLVCRRYYTVLQ